MKRRLIVMLALVLVLLVSGVALATGSYDLSWWTVDSGGGVSTSLNPAYSLGGTIGQPDASSFMSGGGYSLAGGFWTSSEAATAEKVYLPLVTK
jgi:hypothetical protein